MTMFPRTHWSESSILLLPANLAGELGFGRAIAAVTSRPGYIQAICSSCTSGAISAGSVLTPIERACPRPRSALANRRRLAPDYRTIASFRHDNPGAIVGASAAFISSAAKPRLDQRSIGRAGRDEDARGRSSKNIAGADRLARDVAHTEKEIAYYLERLDIIDEAVDQGSTISPNIRRRSPLRSRPSGRPQDRLVRRQDILKDRDERRLWSLAGPGARPMGYGRSPKTYPATTCKAWSM